MKYIAEFEHVKKLFDECYEHRNKYGFRDKFQHTKRVYSWATRLLEREKADREVVLTAAIFHDVGYVYSDEEHPKYSALICREYLRDNNYDSGFIASVSEIVANHGNKELLFKPGTSSEQIILIEADCLDESGALSILRDAMSEGGSIDPSYAKAYERLCSRSILKNPVNFYCVTDTAKNIWQEKRNFYIRFMQNLKNDLMEYEE